MPYQPKAAQPGIDPLSVPCPRCGVSLGKMCRIGQGTHRDRWGLAKARAREHHPPTKTGCQCTNHMGGAKVQHRSRAAAVAWVLRSRAPKGMRYEPYRCPSSDKWHIRTARQEAR